VMWPRLDTDNKRLWNAFCTKEESKKEIIRNNIFLPYRESISELPDNNASGFFLTQSFFS
jgi:hypothetical protein